MRICQRLTEALFFKEGGTEKITLPHTWNALDGQDGGNDYYRGICTYEIQLPDPTEGKRQFIQFEGVNHIAKVYCNDTCLGEHRGGFSTFRFELTDCMKNTENILKVEVDNQASDVYPQKADFTFFGGIYRDVTFIEVEPSHITLMKDGTEGVFVTAKADGSTRVDIFTVDAEGCEVLLVLRNRETQEVKASCTKKAENNGDGHIVFEETINDRRLWSGTENPALYEAEIRLEKEHVLMDTVKVSYGYREFHVNADTGFYLNEKAYPLHGISRHQDRENKGWAINEKDQEEDMQMIGEMGANAIRLAHYQHSQKFYDLCDENGMIVWAEIPFISMFLDTEKAKENTVSQMRELIAQNYNHPSICFWGISNEITIAGETQDLLENQKMLEKLSKEMDPSRLTTMAQLSTVEPESTQCGITDVMGYNLYYGWYIGQVQENGEVLDTLHEKLPGRPLALSEYGADGLITWHSAACKNHDYTEEYQAYYHEEMLKIFETRPYLWGTFVWNMFDFAADARDEGGCKGRNCKGLVTYDRKIRKDAFYIYQAYWSRTPMVHICGSRFKNRAPQERNLKVYTNSKRITLYVNGFEIETKLATDHVCIFEQLQLVPGENEIEVVTDDGIRESICLNAVSEREKAYTMPEDETVAGNWFDEETGETYSFEYPEGYYSIRDTMGDIMKNAQAAAVFMRLKERSSRQRTGSGGGGNAGADQQAGAQMMKSLATVPLQQLIKLGSMNLDTKELWQVNRELNAIKK